MRDDERALAYNIAAFFGTIILGFLLAIVFQPGSEAMMDIAGNYTTTDAAAQGQGYIIAVWSNLHLIIVGFGALQFIVAAAYEARVGGGPR